MDSDVCLSFRQPFVWNVTQFQISISTNKPGKYLCNCNKCLFLCATFEQTIIYEHLSSHIQTFVLLVVWNIVTYSFELSFSASLFFSIEGHSGSHLYPPRELCSCVMNVPTSACTATFGFQNMSEFCNYGEKIVKNHSLLPHQCTFTIHRPRVHITCQWRNQCTRGDGCNSWSTHRF